MPDEKDSSPSSDSDALHRSARVAIKQAKETIERTKALLEKSQRFIASKLPSDQERDS